MSNKILIQGIILTVLMVFIGMFSIFRFFSGAYPVYSYNKPSYYAQYNYRYNYAYNYWPYIPVNAYRGSGAANYVGGYGHHGWSPFLMPGTPDNQGRITYNSHIYIDNKLDYTYYKNPWLLEPRRMNNHQWYARGLWPEKFYY